jgi:hypothetical protein
VLVFHPVLKVCKYRSFFVSVFDYICVRRKKS